MAGMDYSYLCRIEHGKANVSVNLLFRIADGLGIAARDLMPP